MKWLRIPVLAVFLVPACSLLVQSEDFFDGASKSGGAAGIHFDGAAGEDWLGAGGMREAAGASTTEPPEAAGNAGASGAAAGASGATGESSVGGTLASGGAPAGACDDHPQCTPNKVEMGTQACGDCNTGSQVHVHTCSPDTCTWGEWGPWSKCAGATAICTPGRTGPCANDDSCGQRVCNNSCSWGSCGPKPGAECLRIGPGHDMEGSNFRCCGADKWEFCLPECKWSTTCKSCGSDCSCK